jgi:hypothetical protein
MEPATMPAALLSHTLCAQAARQKQVVASDRGRSVMKNSILVGSLLLAATCTAFCDTAISKQVDLGGTSDPYTGDKMVFLVSKEKLESLPKWDGIGPEVDLNMGAAIQAARKQAETEHPGKIGRLRHVLFVNRGGSGGHATWAYSIGFRLLDAPNTRSLSYLVLLDGTVVSAAKIPWKTER